MEIEIEYTKSAQQNASDYFQMSKKARKKQEGAEVAVKELEAKRERIGETAERKSVKRIERKEWYEKYNWFNASNGMLAIGGRSAQQNEEVNAKHFDDKDLFFHADIFGASAVVLKGGVEADPDTRAEVAQFAGCFSSAWENGASTVNVYALKRDQVSKSKEKGSLGTGSFLLSGEREWHKNMALELAAIMREGRLAVIPMSTCVAMRAKEYVLLKPGSKKKSDAAKAIAKRLQYNDIDYIMQHLPAGGFSVK